jgi:multiple sugar transport system ATP-binding protein
MAAITYKNASCIYEGSDKLAVDNLNLDIQDGEFVVLVGPSGSGKSTALRMLAGLEDISEGRVVIGDRVVNHVPSRDRDIAMVFQSYALYPHMSVRENMAFALRLRKRPAAEIRARVESAARTLGLEELLDRTPRQLSGGQRQRVAIGRAIVREPRVFLFDEPLSNLDAGLRVQMRIEIAKLHHNLDATMVYVTHDQVEAMTLADRIVVLDAGNVRQFGAPLELYQHPHNKFVAGFIGSPRMNFLPCTVDGDRVTLPSGTVLPVVAPKSGPRPTELGIRPEHLRPDGSGDATVEGEVITIERLGAESYMYVDIGQEEPLVVKAEAAVPARHGEGARIGIPAAATYLFAADGTCVEREAFH